MEIIVQPDSESASSVGAAIVARAIRRKPDLVLGLATGSTPLALYRSLADMHRRQGLDFSRVTTFNLDEYIGLAPDHPASYHRFMAENFFDHVNLRRENVHIPDGLSPDVPAFCRDYEERLRRCGGIDLQVLGIGSDGHIGFNEPTSSLASRTRIKTLTPETIADNARFFGSTDAVPRHVITMGIGTILESRTLLLLAFGAGKAEAVARSVEGPVTSMVPASALQLHPDARVLLDEAAAAGLQKADYYRWVYEHKPEWQRHE